MAITVKMQCWDPLQVARREGRTSPPDTELTLEPLNGSCHLKNLDARPIEALQFRYNFHLVNLTVCDDAIATGSTSKARPLLEPEAEENGEIGPEWKDILCARNKWLWDAHWKDEANKSVVLECEVTYARYADKTIFRKSKYLYVRQSDCAFIPLVGSYSKRLPGGESVDDTLEQSLANRIQDCMRLATSRQDAAERDFRKRREAESRQIE